MAIPLHHGVDDAECVFMPLGCEMKVDHGGVQAAVTEVLLDTADIDPGLQKMSGVTVTQGVNGDAL